MGLRLDVRFPGENEWQRVTPELAIEVQSYNEGRNRESLKQRMSQSSVESYIDSPTASQPPIIDLVPLTGANAESLPSMRKTLSP